MGHLQSCLWPPIEEKALCKCKESDQITVLALILDCHSDCQTDCSVEVELHRQCSEPELVKLLILMVGKHRDYGPHC